MAFDRLNYEKDWKNKSDFPTYQDSEQQVREDLQFHPDAVRNFINNTLLPALESAKAAAQIGDEQKGNLAATLTHIYDELTRIEEDVKTLAGGDAPEAMRSKLISFEETDWAESGNGYTITIAQADHGRNSSAFGYQLWAAVSGALRSDVWCVAGTSVEYVNGDVLLTAEEPYTGKVAFFGV